MTKPTTVLFAFILSAVAFAAPIKIMPIGDSITYGQGWDPQGGYRAVLREKLVTADYDVDYVGTQSANPGPLAQSGDVQHEGHPGWTVERVTSALPEWFAKVDAPHVILLKIGTNNCNNNHDTVMTQLRALLDEIKRLQPSAHVICATIIPFLNGTEVGSNDVWVQDHNALVRAEVASRAQAGDRISLADIYPVVSPTEGMNDDRHPNETGYRAMADVWFDAIRAAFPDPTATLTEPDLAAVKCEMDGKTGDRFTIWFNGRVGDDATNAAHYAFNSAFTPSKFSLSSDRRSVEITSAQPAKAGVACTVSVSGIPSESGTKTVVPASFEFHFLPYGAKYYVPEAGLYRKVYGFTFPASTGYANNPPVYDFDDHLNVGRYSRIAYYIELQKEGEEMQYMWVSMDKFTDDPGRIAIPTTFALTGEQEIIQQFVYNMKVWSNVDGIVSGDKTRGNIEFWPYNYFGTAKLGIEGATGSYDVDDSCNLYGSFACMQIHDTDALTPLFCFNNWGGNTGNYDLGLGARPNSSNIDWTQSGTSAGWNKHRIMEIYVLEDLDDATVPQLVSFALAESRREITVVFDNPVANEPGLAAKASLSDGTPIQGVERSADGRTLTIRCSYLLKLNGVSLVLEGLHANTPAHTAVPRVEVQLQGEDIVVNYPAAPQAVVDRVADAAGYAYLYKIDIPGNMAMTTGGGADMVVNTEKYEQYHVVNNSAALADVRFSRVAYLLELEDKSGNVTWAWTAFDAYSQDFADYDIPTPGHANLRYVANLDVASNVDGIVEGKGLTTGVIEFSPFNIGGGNSIGVPNATGSFDFGDSLQINVGNYSVMSVANYAAELPNRTGQIVWELSKFTGYGGQIGIGIGNSAETGNIDYTFVSNGNNYKTRTLYVLVKPDYDADESTDYEPVRAVAATDLEHIAVSFKSTVRATAAQARYFAVAGAAVKSAEVSAIDDRDIILTLAAPLAPNSSYTVSTLFPKSTTKSMTIYTLRSLPTSLIEGVEEIGDYTLLNDLTIPYSWTVARDGADYRTDESRFGFGGRKIERIAYALEYKFDANHGGEYRWAWVSMDPFTDDPAKMGVPTITRGIHFQCYVDNISVRAGSSTGVTPIAVGEWPQGNIEFTPSNYASENGLNIPGAAEGVFDFGDRLYGGPDQAGHGCMQIHNYLEQDMILGVTVLGAVPSLLVGCVRDENGNITGDGTYNNNRHNMNTSDCVHELRVFVKLESEAPVEGDKGIGPLFRVQPQSQRVKFVGGEKSKVIELNAYAPSAVSYQWRKNGEDIAGATGPVLAITVTTNSSDVYSVVAFADDGSYTTSAVAEVTGVPTSMKIIIR